MKVTCEKSNKLRNIYPKIKQLRDRVLILANKHICQSTTWTTIMNTLLKYWQLIVSKNCDRKKKCSEWGSTTGVMWWRNEGQCSLNWVSTPNLWGQAGVLLLGEPVWPGSRDRQRQRLARCGWGPPVPPGDQGCTPPTCRDDLEPPGGARWANQRRKCVRGRTKSTKKTQLSPT